MLKKFAFIALLFTFSCSTSYEKEEKSAIVVLSEKIKKTLLMLSSYWKGLLLINQRII
jgi:hypothetical protein